MSGEDLSIQGNAPNRTIEAMQRVAGGEIEELHAEQLTSQQGLIDDLKAANPFSEGLATKQKDLKDQTPRISKPQKSDKTRDETLSQMQKDAEQFEQNNPELRSNILILLRERINPDDSKEEILRKLEEFYPDAALANEALDFLLKTSDGELKTAVEGAKVDHSKQNARAIYLGSVAREAASTGLGNAQGLRKMFNEIADNPRDSTTRFEELSSKYPFKDLKKVVDFLLHSLGATMKSKGASIPKGQLHSLFTETRSLQAILGVYRFFRGRMRLVEKMFKERENVQRK